jgi:hypothetical protein
MTTDSHHQRPICWRPRISFQLQRDRLRFVCVMRAPQVASRQKQSSLNLPTETRNTLHTNQIEEGNSYPSNCLAITCAHSAKFNR